MAIENKKLFLGGGVIGIILLGILTNALWDLLKPIMRVVFEIALNLSTLGVGKFKDNLYEEIAKGLHESVSLQLLLYLHGTFFALIFVLSTSFILKRRELQKSQNKNTQRTVLDKVNNLNDNLHQRSWFVWAFMVYALFSCTIFFLDSSKQKYINQAVTYYGQLINIVDPFITDEQKKFYKSSFSQIKNRQDFVSLINKLEQVAQDNKQLLPEFYFTF